MSEQNHFPKAKNLDEVILEFQHDAPLNPQNEVQWKNFYIDTHRTEVEKLIRTLAKSRDGYKMFFGGHAGNGKSTEINRLVMDQKIQNRYEIIKFDIQEILNPYDLEIVELLLVIAFVIVDFCEEKEFVISDILQKELQQMEQFFRNKLSMDQIQRNITQKEIGIEGKVQAKSPSWGFLSLKASFFSKMKGQVESREIVRESYRPRLDELTDLLNRFVLEIRTQKEHKPVLLIIDGLDRVRSPEKAKKLFVKDIQSLISLHDLSMLLTLPVSIIHSPYAENVKGALGNMGTIQVLKNLRLRTKTGGGDDESRRNIAIMKQAVLNRMESPLIEEDALEEAIRISGGVFRSLISMIANAAIEPSVDEKGRITLEEIEEVAKGERISRSRGLDARHWEILIEIVENKEFSKKMDNQWLELLSGLFVLEYINGEEWYDVNPLLEKGVEERREKLGTNSQLKIKS